MLKVGLLYHKGFLLWGDLYATAKAFFIAYLLVSGASSIREQPLQFSIFLGLVLAFWAFSLSSKNEGHLAQAKSTLKLLRELFSVLLKPLLSVLILAPLLLKGKNPIPFFLIFATLDLFLLVVFRKLRDLCFGYLRNKGYLKKNVLLLGTTPRVKDFIKQNNSNPEGQFNILGILERDESKKGQRYLNIPVLGGLSLLERFLLNCHVDFVVFAFPKGFLNSMNKSILLCQKMGVKGYIFTDTIISKRKRKEFLTGKLILASSSFEHGFPYLLKDFLDKAVALVLVILTLPLFIIISIIIKLTSKGPVFFKQKRCGLNGKRFLMYKFRTMFQDAESLKEKLMGKNEMDGAAFKIKNDPRITKVGKFLRKFSLDELPQFFNVLLGDMSLVGPRPPLAEEVNRYQGWQRKRLCVKPGITCLWQVNGRNEIPFEEWMKMDLKYIKNWSLWLDVQILLKTIPAVIFGKGAM